MWFRILGLNSFKGGGLGSVVGLIKGDTRS